MTSSRLILLFLGFIFLIIITLTSKQIAASLRSRFGGYFPGLITITPTLTPALPPQPTITQIRKTTPVPTQYISKITGAPPKTTPATGPADFIYLALGTGTLLGIAFNKLSAKN